MSEIIEIDLGGKLEDMDFEKDPYDVVEEMISLLAKFDSYSGKSVLTILGPKLESWILTKL